MLYTRGIRVSLQIVAYVGSVLYSIMTVYGSNASLLPSSLQWRHSRSTYMFVSSERTR